MKCQNCGENDANVRYTQIINGVKKQMNLCDKCAKELGIDDISFNMPISFSSFLGNMFDDIYENSIPTLLKPNTLICDSCKTTFDEFLNTGKFGCENCYDAFESQIDPLFKNIHGTSRHVGRIGKYSDDFENGIKQQVGNKQVKKQEKTQINKNEIESKKVQKVDTKKTKIEELEERLKLEIKEERYEDAAKTRDEIKQLKQ